MCVSPGSKESCDNDNLTLAGNKTCENFSLDNIRRILIYRHSAPLSLLNRLVSSNGDRIQVADIVVYSHTETMFIYAL